MRSHLRRWMVVGSRSAQRVAGRSVRRARCSPQITAAFAALTLVPVLTTGAPAPAKAPTSTAAPATKLEDLTVMALGALDGRAVLKGADGKLQVLKVGDTIPGTHAVVSQVLADKIVVQDSAGPDKSARAQTVWISKPAHPGGKSTVQRIDMEAPPARVIEGKTAQQPAKAQDSSTKTKKSK